MYRYSLRTLLVLITFAAIFFGWYRTLPSVRQEHDVLTFNFPAGATRFAYTPAGTVDFFSPMRVKPEGASIWHHVIKFKIRRGCSTMMFVEDADGNNYYYEYDGKTVKAIEKPKWFKWAIFDDNIPPPTY